MSAPWKLTVRVFIRSRWVWTIYRFKDVVDAHKARQRATLQCRDCYLEFKP